MVRFILKLFLTVAMVFNEPLPLFAKMSVHTEELAKLKAHRWQVSCLEFRADGFRLATAGWDKEVHVWDMVNLQVVSTLRDRHSAPITSLSWQGERGEVLCTGSADHTAALWRQDDGAHLQTLAGHDSWVLGTCFSTSGSLLATASWDKSIGIWDAHTGQNINKYTDHTGGVWSVAFHPHSSTVLCSGSEDGSVKMWDLREGKVTQDLTLGHSDAVYCARWSPDGSLVASGSADTKVCVWDVKAGLLANTIYGHSDTVKSLAFNPNTDTAIPVIASAGDCTILLSDPRPTQKAELLSLSPHTPGKEVEAVSISPDGSLLVSGGRDGLLALLTLSVPLLSRQDHNDSVSSKLRNSRNFLERSFDNGSTEDIAEEISQVSTSEGDLSVAASRENVSQEASRGKEQQQTEEPLSKKTAQRARVSRQKRTEKKVVDLPTMIAHLSASVRGSVLEEQLSSSDSEEEPEEADVDAQGKISSLIGVSQKVNKFSQITKKTSVQEIRYKAPEPRLSLLPDDVPETIKENREFFKSREALDVRYTSESREDPVETEYYDGYSSLLPGEEESSDPESSPMHSGHYALKDSSNSQAGHFHNSSKQHSFADELGSADEYYDEYVPFSMI